MRTAGVRLANKIRLPWREQCGRPPANCCASASAALRCWCCTELHTASYPGPRNAKTTNWTSVCCFKTCLMEWPVFVLFFACFSIWGSWSSAWRKKSPKKMRARHRGCAPTPGMPLSSAPPPLPRGPGPRVAGGSFQTQTVCSTKTPLFSCLHRRWELMSTSRLAVGRHVV